VIRIPVWATSGVERFLEPGQAILMVGPDRNHEIKKMQLFIEFYFIVSDNLKSAECRRRSDLFFYLKYSICRPVDFAARGGCPVSPL
jgi:hypothetical protein